MKILVLSPVYPIPTDNGAKRRILGFLEYFGPRHDLTLAALTPEPDRIKDPQSWRNLIVPSTQARIGPLFRSLISRKTYREAKFWEPGLQAGLDSLLQEEDFDLIWVNFLNMCVYLDQLISKPDRKELIILDQHNVETEFWRSFREEGGNPLVRFFAALEENKAGRRQQKWYPRFDAISSVSEHDLGLTRDLLAAPKPDLWIVPNGIDSDYFRPAANQIDRTPKKVIFMGSMDAYMNQQGASWFAAEVWPQVNARFPEAEFYIVGRNPSRKVRNLEDIRGVVVTGGVPDVREFMADAALAVVPIHLGGGTKLKTVEAMAMGLPVVTTTEGAAGLSVTSHDQLVIADSAIQFADEVISLLEDSLKASRMGARARDFVADRFSWKTIYSAVEVKIEHKIKADL